ncbi:MAG: hypothetical protein ACJ8FY_08015 [Gemmataceae bacterium]
MSTRYRLSWRRFSLLALALALVLVGSATSQAPPRPPKRVVPKLEPLAETKLLMEGLNLPNFRALEKLLKKQPVEDEAWVFARGQALLIGETANLLMIRPPRNNGQDSWMERSMGLREAASGLAAGLAKKDFDRSHVGMLELANACNRCHKSFRVPVNIVPFEEPGPNKDLESK